MKKLTEKTFCKETFCKGHFKDSPRNIKFFLCLRQCSVLFLCNNFYVFKNKTKFSRLSVTFSLSKRYTHFKGFNRRAREPREVEMFQGSNKMDSIVWVVFGWGCKWSGWGFWFRLRVGVGNSYRVLS